MASKIDPIVLDGLNYDIWALEMETLLKSKGLWKYTKTSILEMKDDKTKFVKKDEVVWVITTSSLQRYNFTLVVLIVIMLFSRSWSTFWQSQESLGYVDKERIDLFWSHSFDMIEDYLARVNKL